MRLHSEPPPLPAEPFVLRSSAPHFIKRLTAHVLVRLLIFGALPAPLQLHALIFPASLFWCLPDLQLEPIERVLAPKSADVQAPAQPKTRVMGFEHTARHCGGAEQVASETRIGVCGERACELVSDPGYRYDAEDMLVEAIKRHTTVTGGVPTTTEDIAMRAGYDASGRRTLKIGADGLLQYVYAGTDLLSEHNQGGTQLASYAWGGGQIISTYRPGRTDYFSFDSLGSTTNITDSTGAPVARYNLDPWGVIKDPAQLSLSPNRVTFTGHYFGPEVGLTYAKARYLDNSLGIFTTQDAYLGAPEDPMSLHRYAYVSNNPTRHTDPDGHCGTCIGALVGFVWGATQVVGGAVDDAITGRPHTLAQNFSTWAQNIIGGAEMGAAFDVGAGSGGAAVMGSGALGYAGWEAMTFSGHGQSWSEFGKGQAKDAAIGAALGGVLSKAAPLLMKIPGVASFVDWVGAGVARAGAAAVERVPWLAYKQATGDALEALVNKPTKEVLSGLAERTGLGGKAPSVPTMESPVPEIAPALEPASGPAPSTGAGPSLAKYQDLQYVEGVAARASRFSLRRAQASGATGRAAGTQAEGIFDNYAYQMQQRLMAAESPFRMTLQPAASTSTGARVLARTRGSFAGRWTSGAKRLDYGFYSPAQGPANSAPILSGGDFTVTPNGAFGVPGEYSGAFPGARVWGIDPGNIVYGTNPQVVVR